MANQGWTTREQIERRMDTIDDMWTGLTKRVEALESRAAPAPELASFGGAGAAVAPPVAATAPRPAPAECDERCVGMAAERVALCGPHQNPHPKNDCTAGSAWRCDGTGPAHRAPEAARKKTLAERIAEPGFREGVAEARKRLDAEDAALCQTHHLPRPCATCAASEPDTGPDPDYGLDPAPGAVTRALQGLCELFDAIRECARNGGDIWRTTAECHAIVGAQDARALLARLEKEAKP